MDPARNARQSDDFNRRMFAAYFVDGKDLNDTVVIERRAVVVDVNIDCLRGALSDGAAHGPERLDDIVTRYGLISANH